MSGWWLLSAPVLPLLLAGLWCLFWYSECYRRRHAPRRHRLAVQLQWASALAPLPALLIAMSGVADTHLILDGVLLGTLWVLDDVSRALLGMTALLWLLAGGYACRYPSTGVGASGGAQDTGGEASDQGKGGQCPCRLAAFWLLWSLTLAGNLGLILCRDIAGFYSGFALMTFAAYGLVVHSRSEAAQRAGRIYLIMAVIGEMLIFSGLALAASAATSPMLQALPAAIAEHDRGAGIAALLWAGFGIKAGLACLHMWLPLAHPVAPTPASAVLSGAMIKAGLLGWMLVLPLGMASLPWATLALGGGLVAALGAALLGVTQQSPKAVLAYSSISQMGLITVMVAAGLQQPELWSALAPVVLLYALHHGLAKGALFLGVNGLRGRLRGLLWLPALSLAGLPLTTGAVAKVAMKEALNDAAYPGLILMLGLAAAGTTLLMMRFMFCLRQQDKAEQTLAHGVLAGVSGAAVLLGVVGLHWLVPEISGRRWPDGADAVQLLWPVAVGLALGWLALHLRQRMGLGRLGVPPGDLVVLLEVAFGWLGRAWHARATRGVRRANVVRPGEGWLQRIGGQIGRVERGIEGLAGALFVVLAVAIVVALLGA